MRMTEITDNTGSRAAHSSAWRLGVGAEVQATGVFFRVWAPKCHQVEVVIEYGHNPDRVIPLLAEAEGYFSAFVPQLTSGALYWYRLDGNLQYPDPCSRFQPDGPHGPSLVVDPSAFTWHDHNWRGVQLPGQVLYELHIGAFTPEGTFDAAIRQLPELKRIGITVIEVLPIAEFPGQWNWGYDGVDLYAPTRNYGDADALRRFVDAAHLLGVGVILDVVYNHLGPEGNYLGAFSQDYFTDRYTTDWGAAINYDGPNCTAVREFFVRNACYWIAEFHLDGLRLDATQNIYDRGPRHILADLSQRVRATASPRTVILIAENEPQDVRCITAVDQGGYGLDGMWNDDFHHAARVALTGRREAYYTDYRGQAQEFISTAKRGFLYQGQRYHWQQQPRGSYVTTEPAGAFVIFTENHDQVANTLHGQRLISETSPAAYRALTAFMLIAPGTPLLFMGQEFGATSPFLFFADHADDALAASVYKGRKQFLAQFPSYASTAAQAAVPDPVDPSTFARSKLDLSQRLTHAAIYRFHQELLQLRRADPLIARQDRTRLDGAVLSLDAFVLRFFGDAEVTDRLLVVNLGSDLEFVPAPEPLLAPIPDGWWDVQWSSEDPRYGGFGIVKPHGPDGWRIPGASATFLVGKRSL
jgi:maltooligosyltrehalose trehalohydrolase